MEDRADIEEAGKSVAAPFIFIIVLVFQFLSKYLDDMKKKKGSASAVDVQLRAEIKQLYKEASTYSQPSTFAQAAKLRRTAAAKEKELAKSMELIEQKDKVNGVTWCYTNTHLDQELQSKEVNSSYDAHVKKLMILKVVIYSAFVLWFWRSPVAAVSNQFLQPFGRFLSWRAGGSSNGNVMVGVIPWLIVSTRVGKFVYQKFT